MKVYAVSILALAGIQDTTTIDGAGTYVEHLPALIPAASIEEAAERARAFALERWKVSDGWYSHQARIMPVPVTFYEAVFNARDAGILDQLQDEPMQTFSFSLTGFELLVT